MILQRSDGRAAGRLRSRVSGTRRGVALAAAAAAVLTGCGSGNDAGVVTVTTKVAAPVTTSSGVTGGPGPAQPTSPTPGSSATESGRSPVGAPGKTSGSPSAVTAPTTSSGRSSAASRPATSPARATTGSTPSTGPKAPIRLLPSSQIPTANAAPVSPDTPGPETGPKCATNATYVDEQPTGLRSDVIKAWRNVEKYANADGIIVCLNDGKRSRAQQQAQYDQYRKQYGKAAADQLVLKPDKSAHVTGIAIDVQPAAAFQWLQATKGALGLCRTFDNEGWHFEYDVSYFKGCPPRKPRPEH